MSAQILFVWYVSNLVVFWSVNPSNYYLVQQINDKFGPNCTLQDKSMKLGTIILDTIRVILKTERILDSDSDNVYSTKIDTDTMSGLQKT